MGTTYFIIKFCNDLTIAIAIINYSCGIKRPNPDSDGMITFSAHTILDAIAIISAKHSKEFNPETHMVYHIVREGTITHANGKQQIRTLFGASNPVSSMSAIQKFNLLLQLNLLCFAMERHQLLSIKISVALSLNIRL